MANTEIINIELENYLGEKLNPTSITIGGYTELQGESNIHRIGSTESGSAVNAYLGIRDNVFNIEFHQTTSQAVIGSIRYFNLQQVVTENFTYTKFKFVE